MSLTFPLTSAHNSPAETRRKAPPGAQRTVVCIHIVILLAKQHPNYHCCHKHPTEKHECAAMKSRGSFRWTHGSKYATAQTIPTPMCLACLMIALPDFLSSPRWSVCRIESVAERGVAGMAKGKDGCISPTLSIIRDSTNPNQRSKETMDWYTNWALLYAVASRSLGSAPA